jgi:hypothetical protein
MVEIYTIDTEPSIEICTLAGTQRTLTHSMYKFIFNPDFPLGRRMSASGFSRQFCANFEGNSGAIDAKIGAKMTEKQPRSTAQAQSAA